MEQKPHQSLNVRVQFLSKCQKQLSAWHPGGLHVRLSNTKREDIVSYKISETAFSAVLILQPREIVKNNYQLNFDLAA